VPGPRPSPAKPLTTRPRTPHVPPRQAPQPDPLRALRIPKDRLGTNLSGVSQAAPRRHRLPRSHTCTYKCAGAIVAHLGGDIDIQAEMPPASTQNRSQRTSQSARRPPKRPRPSRTEGQLHRGPSAVAQSVSAAPTPHPDTLRTGSPCPSSSVQCPA